MGSHPSKRIQSADISRKTRATTPQRSLSLSNTTTTTKVKHFQPEHEKNERDQPQDQESTKSATELQKELIATKKLMTEIECQNLDLQDQIQILEQQLEFNQQEHEKHPGNHACAETVQVKDQMIEKLEKEIETLHADLSELRLKCRKKIRTIKRKNSLAKNEGSMEILELKEEMKKLEEENQKLKKKNREKSEKTELLDDGKSEEMDKEERDAGKMKIILDLSAQVSEQDTLLTELGNKLNEREKHIKKLEKQLKEESSNRPREQEKTQSESHEKTVRYSDVEGDSSVRSRVMFGYETDSANYHTEPKDINWYTNQTFEQLSKGKRAPVTSIAEGTGAWTQCLQDDDDDNEEDEGTKELNAISEEIKKLQRRSKKKKGKHNSMGNGHNDLSLRVNSKDSFETGEFSKRDASEKESTHSGNVFVTQTFDTTDDSDISTNREGLTELEENRSKQVDNRAGMRQISGLGKKSRRKQGGKGMVRDDGPVGHTAVLSVSGRDPELSEASQLLDSIDEDMRHLTTSTRQRLAVVSS